MYKFIIDEGYPRGQGSTRESEVFAKVAVASSSSSSFSASTSSPSSFSSSSSPSSRDVGWC